MMKKQSGINARKRLHVSRKNYRLYKTRNKLHSAVVTIQHATAAYNSFSIQRSANGRSSRQDKTQAVHGRRHLATPLDLHKTAQYNDRNYNYTIGGGSIGELTGL